MMFQINPPGIPVIIFIIAIALVVVIMRVNIFLVSKNTIVPKRPITTNVIMLSVIKTSIVLLFVGTILCLICLAIAGFDWSNLTVSGDGFILFGFD